MITRTERTLISVGQLTVMVHQALMEVEERKMFKAGADHCKVIVIVAPIILRARDKQLEIIGCTPAMMTTPNAFVKGRESGKKHDIIVVDNLSSMRWRFVLKLIETEADVWVRDALATRMSMTPEEFLRANMQLHRAANVRCHNEG